MFKICFYLKHILIPSFALIFGVDNRCNCASVDRVLRRVPLGVHLLFLELCELSAVVNDHEELPDEEQGQTNQNDASNHTPHYRNELRTRGTLWCIHHHHVSPGSIGCVAVVDEAVVIVLFFTATELFVSQWWKILDFLHLPQTEEVAFLRAALSSAGLLHQTFNALFVLTTDSTTRGAQFTGGTLVLWVTA